MKYVIVVLISLISQSLLSQISESEMLKMITSNDQKEWILKAHIVYLKSESKCSQGVSYFFNQNGSGYILSCVDSTYIEEHFDWQIKQIDKFDWIITISNKKYFLVVQELENRDILKLRTKSGGRVEETTDLILHYLK